MVLDGAYSEFITDKKYTDGIDLVHKYQNLIVTRTFQNFCTCRLETWMGIF